jgi:hypothetical protein
LLLLLLLLLVLQLLLLSCPGAKQCRIYKKKLGETCVDITPGYTEAMPSLKTIVSCYNFCCGSNIRANTIFHLLFPAPKKRLPFWVLSPSYAHGHCGFQLIQNCQGGNPVSFPVSCLLGRTETIVLPTCWLMYCTNPGETSRIELIWMKGYNSREKGGLDIPNGSFQHDQVSYW